MGIQLDAHIDGIIIGCPYWWDYIEIYNFMSKILDKTMGEQTGSAKNHLETVEVNVIQPRNCASPL